MTEQEEIQKLRELIAKQQLQLKNQEELLAQKDEVIRKQNIRIENMTQALLHAKKKIFGRSSEAAAPIEGQMFLFETTTELAKKLLQEQKAVTVPAHKRKIVPRKAGIREEMLSVLPKEYEEYVIDDKEVCSVCGSELKNVGKQYVRTEVEYQQAKLIVKQIYRQVKKCTSCGTDGSTNAKDHLQKAAVPASVLSHSIATPSLAAHIMYQKFAMGIPLNRMEKDFYRMGLVLPRKNMANWVIRCSEDWFSPIYERIHECLIQKCENLHMDETRIQVNKEPGKKASSDSFMWVLQSGSSEEIKATLFYYSRTRSRKVAVELLTGYQGYLTTDAYTVYENLDMEGIKNNFCWSHVRRYWLESIPLDNNGKELEGSKGAEAIEYIDLLFRLEGEMKELSYEEKKEKRQVASRAMLDAFWTWVDETASTPTTNEKLTKALNYTINHKKQLEMFLEDGRLDISNNLCESHIRPFATARRAWLFADTPRGAVANAVLYTLVESARANDLDVYEYLKHILTVMPNVDFYSHPEIIDSLLPWSEKLPEICHLSKYYKKRCLDKQAADIIS